MHLSEFKAWFDGFTENIKGQPTQQQWKRIKERVGEITATYTPPPVFVDRYWYPYRTYWPWIYTTAGVSGDVTSDTITVTMANWNDAGRAENLSLNDGGHHG